MYLSLHAQQRMQQRGVRRQAVETLLSVADQSVHVGGGYTAYSLTRKCAGTLQKAGWPAPTLDRLCQLTLVIADDGTVVTVLHPDGKRGRFYRRQGPTRSAARRRPH